MNNNTLWYKQPAKDWTQSLPIGNGRFGAVLYGRTDEELLQLNEDSLWSGYPEEWYNENALPTLKPVREALINGEIKKAQRLVEQNMVGKWTQSYLPMGDVHIKFEADDAPQDYTRKLELENAIITDSYTIEKNTYKREAFATAVDDALIYRITTENKINFNITLDSPIIYETKACGDILMLCSVAPKFVTPHYWPDDNPITYGNTPEEMGMRFTFGVKVKVSDGEVIVTDKEIKVINTSEATLYISGATSFNGCDRHPYLDGKDELSIALNLINSAYKKDYTKAREQHVCEYKSLFDRVDFYLESEDRTSIPTDERLLRNRTSNDDLGLTTLLMQYGRYLLISCSREGTKPANLQGIWNKDMRAYWSCNYTSNINFEMNYWPAEVCNLSECQLPLIEYVKDVVKNGEEVARRHYDCSGWVAHHNLDIWATGLPAGNNGKGGDDWAACLFWPMGGAWISHQIWEHYAFTMDKNYLKDTAYPIMKKAAEFCLDWLVETDDGRLVTMPATSPENHYFNREGERCAVDIATTCDISSIYDLFTNCICAIDELEEDFEFKARLQTASLKLPPLRKGKFGELAEWSQDFEETDKGHRHVSHMFGVYPGNRISETSNAEYLDACKKTIARRIENNGGGTGWGLAWVVCIYARLKQEELGQQAINRLINTSVYDNLFDLHPPLSKSETEVFQIDGNFGFSAGIAEMLVQSHNGYIELLPSVPKLWKTGFIKGLKVRGGFEVDIKWENNKLAEAVIKSTNLRSCLIKYNNKLIEVTVENSRYTLTSRNFSD